MDDTIGFNLITYQACPMKQTFFHPRLNIYIYKINSSKLKTKEYLVVILYNTKPTYFEKGVRIVVVFVLHA